MARTGILLINSGTPDEPTEEAIARYLEEMLSDRALISAPPIIWKRVLKHAILPKRPAKTRPLYERIWTPEGSPFMTQSYAQATRIAALLREEAGDDVCVELSMRYGNPSIPDVLARLREAGCSRVVAVPLYPQYVNVCAGSCLARVRECLRALKAQGWAPELVEVRQFHRQPAYIQAIAENIREAWPAADRRQESRLIFSWHSTLLKDIERGDPYLEQCTETARAVAERLGLPDDAWTIAFQSRFDNRKWLSPFTPVAVEGLVQAGCTDLAIVCPGFVADNLETSVEIAQTLRDDYLRLAPKGARFTYVPALNDSPLLARAVVAEVCAALA